MDKRMNDHAANIAWLSEFLKSVTDVDLVVEYLPEKRASSFGFGFDVDREALYRATFKGVEHSATLPVARVALKDEQYVRAQLLHVLPKVSEPEPENELH